MKVAHRHAGVRVMVIVAARAHMVEIGPSHDGLENLTPAGAISGEGVQFPARHAPAPVTCPAALAFGTEILRLTPLWRRELLPLGVFDALTAAPLEERHHRGDDPGEEHEQEEAPLPALGFLVLL